MSFNWLNVLPLGKRDRHALAMAENHTNMVGRKIPMVFDGHLSCVLMVRTLALPEHSFPLHKGGWLVGWLGQGLTCSPTHSPRHLPCGTRLGGRTQVSGYRCPRVRVSGGGGGGGGRRKKSIFNCTPLGITSKRGC